MSDGLNKMTIEDEIWDEFNELSNYDSDTMRSLPSAKAVFNLSSKSKIGVIDRIDKNQNIWHQNNQVHSDELIEKVLLGEKKWDNIVDDLPKRIVSDYHEPEFRRLNKLLLSVFHTPEHARDYLKIKIFPEGLFCVKCGTKKIYTLQSKQYKCVSCKYKFSDISNTMFYNTKLDLTKWYSLIVILTSKNRIGTPRLSDILHLTQKTTYYMARKVKNNINDPFLREINRGIFEYKPLT